jgi:hypothetical protein
MPWINEQYFYSSRVLRTIAENYTTLYSGFPMGLRGAVVNPFEVADYKADFDMALSRLGRHWELRSSRFADYNFYSKTQRAVIADILGTDDGELESAGFYNIPQLKGYAYYRMRKVLNGED